MTYNHVRWKDFQRKYSIGDRMYVSGYCLAENCIIPALDVPPVLAEAVSYPIVGESDSPSLPRSVVPVGEDGRPNMSKHLPVSYALHFCDTLDEARDAYYQDLLKAQMAAKDRMGLIQRNSRKIATALNQYKQLRNVSKRYFVATEDPVKTAKEIFQAAEKKCEAAVVNVILHTTANLNGLEELMANTQAPDKLHTSGALDVQMAVRQFLDFGASFDVAILMADAGEEDVKAAETIAKQVVFSPSDVF